MTKPTVIAHRGFSAVAPENTLPAFQQAIDAGADMIEFDVRLTTDKQFVVIHDATLERTTSGCGIVENHTLTQLQMLDAGAWFGRGFTGTILPSLGEALSLCENRVLVNVEVKTELRDDLSLTQLADLVAEHVSAFRATRSVVISSYTHRIITHLRDRHKNLTTALLSDEPSADEAITKLAYASGATALHIPHRLASSSLAKRTKQAGLLSAVHTVNKTTHIQTLIEMGFDALFTDHPDRMRAYVDRHSGCKETTWSRHLSTTKITQQS
ncbi:MAG: glycerophosphoryl diester phosphodiesterase [Acidobacteriota bacterium]|nr:MAG: glycerophosphoryl diester phosphodiesterase [Acidobacteriota bacterium]